MPVKGNDNATTHKEMLQLNASNSLGKALYCSSAQKSLPKKAIQISSNII